MYDLPISKGTRVEVAAPQGSVYDGKRGTVVRIEPHLTGGTAFVMLDGMTHSVTFGLTELVALAGGLLVLR